jgi:hypothetical protein
VTGELFLIAPIQHRSVARRHVRVPTLLTGRSVSSDVDERRLGGVPATGVLSAIQSLALAPDGKRVVASCRRHTRDLGF